MKFSKIELKTKENYLEALSNLTCGDDVFFIYDAVEDSQNSRELGDKLCAFARNQGRHNVIYRKPLSVRETDEYIRFKLIDGFINVSYLFIYK